MSTLVADSLESLQNGLHASCPSKDASSNLADKFKLLAWSHDELANQTSTPIHRALATRPKDVTCSLADRFKLLECQTIEHQPQISDKLLPW